MSFELDKLDISDQDKINLILNFNLENYNWSKHDSLINWLKFSNQIDQENLCKEIQHDIDRLTTQIKIISKQNNNKIDEFICVMSKQIISIDEYSNDFHLFFIIKYMTELQYYTIIDIDQFLNFIIKNFKSKYLEDMFIVYNIYQSNHKDKFENLSDNSELKIFNDFQNALNEKNIEFKISSFLNFIKQLNCDFPINLLHELKLSFEESFRPLIEIFILSMEATRQFSTHLMLPNLKQYVSQIQYFEFDNKFNQIKFDMVTAILKEILNHKNKRLRRKYQHFIDIIYQIDKDQMDKGSKQNAYFQNQYSFIKEILPKILQDNNMYQYDLDLNTLDSKSLKSLTSQINFVLNNMNYNQLYETLGLGANGLQIRGVEYLLKYQLDSDQVLTEKIDSELQIKLIEKTFEWNEEQKFLRPIVKLQVYSLIRKSNITIDSKLIKQFGQKNIKQYVKNELLDIGTDWLDKQELNFELLLYFILNSKYYNSEILINQIDSNLDKFFNSIQSDNQKLIQIPIFEIVQKLIKNNGDNQKKLVQKIIKSKYIDKMINYVKTQLESDYIKQILQCIFTIDPDNSNTSQILLDIQNMSKSDSKYIELLQWIIKTLKQDKNQFKVGKEQIIEILSIFEAQLIKEKSFQKYTIIIFEQQISVFIQYQSNEISNIKIQTDKILELLNGIQKENSQQQLSCLNTIYSIEKGAKIQLLDIIAQINSSVFFKSQVKQGPKTIEQSAQLLMSIAISDQSLAKPFLDKIDYQFEQYQQYFRQIQLSLFNNFISLYQSDKPLDEFLKVLMHQSTWVESRTHQVEQFNPYPISLVHSLNFNRNTIEQIDERQRMKLIIFQMVQMLDVKIELVLDIQYDSQMKLLTSEYGLALADKKSAMKLDDINIDDKLRMIDNGEINCLQRPNAKEHKAWLKILQLMALLSKNFTTENKEIILKNEELKTKVMKCMEISLCILRLNNFSNIKAQIEIVISKLLINFHTICDRLFLASLEKNDMQSSVNQSILMAAAVQISQTLDNNLQLNIGFIKSIEDLIPLYFVSASGQTRSVGMILANLMQDRGILTNEIIKTIVSHYKGSRDNKVILDKTKVIHDKYLNLVKNLTVESLFSMDIDEYGEQQHSSFVLEIKKEIAIQLTLMSQTEKAKFLMPKSQHEEWRVELEHVFKEREENDLKNVQNIPIGFKEIIQTNPNSKDGHDDFQQKYKPTYSKRFPIQVVCSLLQDEVNMAGICRTSECLNIEAVIVPNRQVLEKNMFKALSVSAEKHLPIFDVMPSSLPEWLSLMKAKGQKVAALEQTFNAVNLQELEGWLEARGSSVGEEKWVVLLGNESKGLSMELLKQADVSVIIPMQGSVRSFNVHVSCSMLLYEFTRGFAL